MAESIWNNNYLLSNLDAQKLYAQSPLTTGVSGSSAYIGIEPSARYNETVLFENTSGVVPSNFPIQLNEPITNFETVKFYWQTFNYPGKNHTVSEKMTDVNDITLEGFIFNKNTSACFNVIWELESTNTTVNNISTKYINWTSTAAPGDASTFFSMYKIVGINRKEV